MAYQKQITAGRGSNTEPEIAKPVALIAVDNPLQVFYPKIASNMVSSEVLIISRINLIAR